MSEKKILIIEDDVHICDLISMYLQKEGFKVFKAHDGLRGVEVFKSETPHLIILDIMLPKLDGWEVCKEVKRISNVPIIMLTAKSDTFDKVLGLKIGADDYMVKPFEPRELIARVDAVLRRTMPQLISHKQIVLPNFLVDMDNYIIKIYDQTMELPHKEMELLYFLVLNRNRVFTREQLLENIWGYDFEGDNRTIDVHIKRLREKLESLASQYRIKTVWGVGYKFEVLEHA